jgi:hypothetical protein
MNYFTSCWEVVEIKRWEALATCIHEESKADFINAEQESRYLLDIFAQRLSLPRSTSVDGPYLNAACEKAKRSLSWTGAELSILKACANNLEEWLVNEWYVLSRLQLLSGPVTYTSPEITRNI